MGRSNARRATARTPSKAPTAPAVIDAEVDQLEALFDRIAPLVVAATFWFEPPTDGSTEPLSLQVNGKLASPTGARSALDRFVYDQPLPAVPAGSGPVAMTVKVPGLPPGTWALTARILQGPAVPAEPGSPKSRPTQITVLPATWSWRRWHLSTADEAVVSTTRGPFVRPPAVILGSWVVLVVLGILVALVLQTYVISAADLPIDGALGVSILAVLAGVAGAKLWFVFLHHKERRREGWSVQGFVAAVAVAAPVLLLVGGIPVGVFLDASAPGLMIGLAIGRIGCFFTGCCCGCATASRWGVWSSNRRVGARRVPTQLMESAINATIGIVALAIVISSGTRNGGVFIAAVALYTLLRQGIVRYREEGRQSTRGPLIVACIALVVLIGDLSVLAIT